MTRTSKLALVAFAALALPVSAAPDAPLHTSAVITFTRLPEGHVPFPEGTPPPHIGAGEQLAGFYLTGMPADQERMMKLTSPHMGITYLFTNEEAARSFGSHGMGRHEPTDTCLADGAEVTRFRRGMGNDDDTPLTWPARYTGEASFSFESPPTPNSQPDVHAMHTERFVAGTEGKASIDIVDAWVDSRTRGARLLYRGTLALTRVFVAPNALEVYAARDGEVLQVVLHSAKSSLPQFIRERQRSLVVNLPEQNMGVSDCGHLRFLLRAPPGDGQMGTLQTSAYLPPSDEELRSLGDPAASDYESKLFRMMRQRTFQLSVSASSTSSDPHPVVSISLAWLGRERASDYW